MNKFDQHSKVVRIIRSSLNMSHVRMCEGIVDRFHKVYKDKFLYSDLRVELDTVSDKLKPLFHIDLT